MNRNRELERKMSVKVGKIRATVRLTCLCEKQKAGAGVESLGPYCLLRKPVGKKVFAA